MFGFNNMLGVIVDKKYLEKISGDEREVLDVYIKFCEAIVEKNIKFLVREIQGIKIKNLLNIIKSKDKWIEDIEKENIKYFGIELLNISIKIKKDIALIKSKNKVRAKIYNYRGSWIKESYVKLTKENYNWKIIELNI